MIYKRPQIGVNKKKRWGKEIFILSISLLVLFIGFQFNYFSAADQQWFENFQSDSESLVIGRLVKSREDGVFSEVGRLGRYHGLMADKPWETWANQTDLYLKNITGGNYQPYNSQIGLQGIIFSALDKIIDHYNLIEVEYRISLFHSLASILLAFVLTSILLLVYLEFGFVTVFVVLVTVSLSQWLIVIGKNLYWVAGLMFIPMLIVWIAHKVEETKDIFYLKTVLIVIALSMFVKSAAGYEFTSSILVSMVSPIIFYSLKNNWTFSKFFRRFITIGISGVLGLVIAFTTHTFQLSKANNSTFVDSLQQRFNHASARMHTTEGTFPKGAWKNAVTTPTLEVLNKYWNGEAIDFENSLDWKYFNQVNYGELIFIILIFSTLGLISSEYSRSISYNRKKIIALSFTTWFSLLAPLSWFILAKVHSGVHIHLNHVLWHIPFTIFGFSLVGFVTYLLFKDLYTYSKYLFSAIIASICLLFISGYVLAIADANAKVKKLVADKYNNAIIVKEAKTGFIISLTDDNKLIYYKPECDPADIDDRFFLHIYPREKSRLKKGIIAFNNLDFNWSKHAIKVPLFSAHYGGCLAVRNLPHYPFNRISTGVFADSKRLWGESIVLEKHLEKKHTIYPYDLNNPEWAHGISKQRMEVLVENSVKNRMAIKKGDFFSFSFSGRREVLNIDYSHDYITFKVNGDNLSPARDGNPNKIEIIRSN